MTVPTQATPVDHLAELRQQLDRVKAEVDALQVASAEKRRPQWKQITSIVAVVGVLLTAGTFGYGEWQKRISERRAARVELSELVQRLTAIPLDHARLVAENPATAYSNSSNLVTEARVLTDRALDVMDRLGGQASAAEYFAVANAQIYAALPEEAGRTAAQGLDRATTEDHSRLELLRLAAKVAVIEGDRARAERHLEEARQGYRQPYDAFHTEWFWAGVAITESDCSSALQHAQAARDEAARVNRQLSDPSQLVSMVDQLVATCSGALVPDPSVPGPPALGGG